MSSARTYPVFLSDQHNKRWVRAIANLSPESQRVIIEATWIADDDSGLIAIGDVKWQFDAGCKGT